MASESVSHGGALPYNWMIENSIAPVTNADGSSSLLQVPWLVKVPLRRRAFSRNLCSCNRHVERGVDGLIARYLGVRPRPWPLGSGPGPGRNTCVQMEHVGASCLRRR